MYLFKAILFCVVTTLTVSYAWKMRGTVIGGEKGAMLPGMLLGLNVALFCGGEFKNNFWVVAAAGLVGMTYGGIEPYGDSISFMMDRNKKIWNPRKGLSGLVLKGAVWFGVCGGFIGLSMNAMAGKYSLKEIIVFMILIPISQALGYCIFNLPYDEKKNKYPKIYFSYESREEWGSNVGIILLVLLFSIVKLTIVPIILTIFGILFGAVGWVVAMKVYYYSNHPFKNGKYLFGILSEKNIVGGWGNMEYTLGAFGGFGVSLGVLTCFTKIKELNVRIHENGLFEPLKEKDGIILGAFVLCCVFIILINFIEHRIDARGGHYNGFIMDIIERPLFNTIPFFFVLISSSHVTKLLTVFELLFVLLIKNGFDRFDDEQPRKQFIIVGSIFTIISFVVDIIIGGFPAQVLFAVGGIPYMIADIVWHITKKSFGMKSLKSLNGYSFYNYLMSFQAIVITILGLIIPKIV